MTPPLADLPISFRLNWDLLKKFYYAVSLDPSKEAAEYLKGTQPGLDHLMQDIEEELGIPLFLRAYPTLILTPHGQMVFKAVEKAFNYLESMRQVLEGDQDHHEGLIRIWTDSVFAHFYLNTISTQFNKAYPNIQLEINTDHVPLRLELGETDVIIKPTFKSLTDVKQIHLLRKPLKLYASQTYLKEFGRPESPADLDDHRLIAYGNPKDTKPFYYANWHLTINYQAGQVRQPWIILSSIHECLEQAKNGMGIICCLADKQRLNDYGLVEVLEGIFPTTCRYSYMYATERPHKRIELFGDYLLNYLAECKK